MAITASNSVVSAGGGASRTATIVTIPATTERIIAVHAIDVAPSSRDFSGATFDGNAMTIVGEIDDNGATGRPLIIYEYDVSGQGALSNLDVVASIDSTTQHAVVAFCLEGSSVARRTVGTGVLGSSDTYSFSCTSQSGDFVICGIVVDVAATANVDLDSSQTLINSHGTGSSPSALIGAYSQTGSATTTQVDFSENGLNSRNYGGIAVAYYEASSTLEVFFPEPQRIIRHSGIFR